MSSSVCSAASSWSLFIRQFCGEAFLERSLSGHKPHPKPLSLGSCCNFYNVCPFSKTFLNLTDDKVYLAMSCARLGAQGDQELSVLCYRYELSVLLQVLHNLTEMSTNVPALLQATCSWESTYTLGKSEDFHFSLLGIKKLQIKKKISGNT